jgi:hypothetical protein
VGKSIRQITESATRVKALMDDIQTGSQEQSRRMEQIGSAIKQMDEVTNRGAANAEESAAAGQELAAQTRELNFIVERLRAIIENTGEPPSAPVPAPPRPARSAPALSRAPVTLPKVEPASEYVFAQSRSVFPLDESEGPGDQPNDFQKGGEF